VALVCSHEYCHDQKSFWFTAAMRRLRNLRGNRLVSEAFRERSRLLAKGRHYEDFKVGEVFNHHWGRTVGEGDNTLFTTLTLHYNPNYFNRIYALENGHPTLVVAPLLVFNVVFGLSVEDLSEAGGPFLGVDALRFERVVYVADTLSASSVVMEKRLSSSRPEFGIVTWQTAGRNQDGQIVVEFRRTNLVRRRS
jgi:itaconyl-CoA hydratase